MRMPPLLADLIHARGCKLKCEKFLTLPWVSRQLVSFLESSEQISRFGAAFKKPPPKRRFLVHQQGLEPGTR